ncbi:MAG: hypothetical protein ISQ34_01105 [Rickettsiales bacterium]|nr:hypothetical protein [Rickettsiales bacterium]
MNYKKVKINIVKKISFFVSTAFLALTSPAYSQTCPTISSTDYVADTSTLGYATSHNELFLNQQYIAPELQALSSTECKDLPPSINAQPGRNCFYDGKPLCHNINGSLYEIPAENIFSGIIIPRYNCHDLSDLPLCTLLSANQIQTDAGKNCVLKCSELPKETRADSSGNPIALIRGQDYAIHNKDCVRFCDELSDEEAIDSSLPNNISCVAKSCQQLGRNANSIPITPKTGSNGNCNISPCNLLYPEELRDISYNMEYDDANNRTNIKYCDAKLDAENRDLKCYHFSKSQLKYTVRDKMCQIHKCSPSCQTYKSQSDENGDGSINEYDNDDTLNITSKGTAYSNIYRFHQYACLDINSATLCEPVICLPIITKQYRCTVDGSAISGTNNDIIPNPNCGSSSEESDCTDHFCEKVIDCNIIENQDKRECLAINEETTGTRNDDDLNSWFYRPRPLDKAVKIAGNYTIIDPDIDAKLCFPESVFEDRAADWNNIADQNDWGWDSKIVIPKVCVLGVCTPEIVIDLGYFHSSISPDATRAGGMCKFDESDNVGFRGAGQPYLCYREGDGGPQVTGGIYQHLSEYTAFHKGYVETTFLEDNNATHKLDVCLRFRNALRPDDGYSETCGSRECAVSCMGFAGGCSMQNCGYDRCKTLKVEEHHPHLCAMSPLLFGSTFDELISGQFENNLDYAENTFETNTTGMVEDDEGNLIQTTENNWENYEGYTEESIDDLVSHFEDAGGPCLSYIDQRLRLRAVKINNYICTFLDVKGLTAYDDNVVDPPIKFADGSEVLIDENGIEYCLDGTIKNGGCNAFDTTQEPWSVEVWRTVKLTSSVNIPYILNNQPSSADFRGYLDRDGKVHLEQNCIKATLRTAPVDFYNMATPENSPKLFIPPLYIKNVRRYMGGPISVPQNIEQKYGTTNFHYPEIEVAFGDQTLLLNLTKDDQGDEDRFQTISSVINDASYSKEVFIKKEYSVFRNHPILCLYEKIQNNGTYVAPYQIGCVDREKPVIDNSILALIDPNLPEQRIIVSPLSDNTYDNSSISLQYLAGYGANGIDDNCNGDDECTQIVTLSNQNINVADCDDTVEKYRVCALREECSQLNIECMNNEINIQNAMLNNQSLTDLLATRNWCNDHLVNMCNNKLGLSSDPNSSIYNTNPNNVIADNKAYGWFNEICFTKGKNTTSFNENLVKVIAHNPSVITNNVKGKCLIDPSSPYLNDNDPSTNCDDGGFAPHCLCVKYTEGVTLQSGEIARLQTEREAGLCIDMPEPETCPAISYNTSPNTNPDTDPDYVSWSLNITSGTYGTTEGSDVHFSHELRTNGVGHASFPTAMMGMQHVEGKCKGFWKNKLSATSIELPPTRSCNNISGTAQWANSVTNQCIRYSCEAVNTRGIKDGTYLDNYGNSYENSQEKGLSHGFATWPYHLQSTDFAELETANACIIGFKKTGSYPHDANNDDLVTQYLGGTLPTRYCNQLGVWQATQNNCERIKCSPVNLPGNYDPNSTTPDQYYTDVMNGIITFDFSHDSNNPNPTHQLNDYSYTGRYDKDINTGLISNVQWNYWLKSGGAIFFDETLSSRSDASIESSSKTQGYCNNELGFFQSTPNVSPSLECDHLGNWIVKNQCVTRCDIVPAGIESEDESNGYSQWPKTDVELIDPINIENNFEQVSGRCLTANESTRYDINLLPYPYPPLRNRDGENYKIHYDSNDYYTFIQSITLDSHLNINQFVASPESDSIPADVKNDTRFHFLDSSDQVEKWSIPNESLPTGSSLTGSAPEPTRLCKWVKLETGFTTNYWHPADNKCIASCPSGNYDPRLNAGITKHQLYDHTSTNKTKEFYVSWPEASFGTWVFYTNNGFSFGTPPSSINGMDASHFSNDPTTNPIGRTNGKYIIARKCGTNGKWEDPQPHCATNNGIIPGSNANYNGESIAGSKTIAVEDGNHAMGSCYPSPPYYPKGQDAGSPQPVSQYSCQYHDANNNIDQVYFKHESGEPCEIYCYSPDNQSFQNSTNKSGDQYVKAGNYLELSCKNGYGKNIIGGSSGSDNTCGREVVDRTSQNPTILCNSNGSWSPSVTNDCDACRSCTHNSGDVALSYNVRSNNHGKIYRDSTTIIFESSGQQNCGSKERTCGISNCINQCNNNSHFNRSHGDKVKINTEERWSCKKSCGIGKCTRHTDLNASMSIQCIDGKWQGVDGGGGSSIDCNNI